MATLKGALGAILGPFEVSEYTLKIVSQIISIEQQMQGSNHYFQQILVDLREIVHPNYRLIEYHLANEFLGVEFVQYILRKEVVLKIRRGAKSKRKFALRFREPDTNG